MCADIVFIGGGPVGLWTAIQTKKNNPGLAITVYERHETYQRSHVLRLQHASLLLWAKTNNDEAEAAFFEEVTGNKDLRQVFARSAMAGAVYVATNDLENALKDYAAKLGIKIVYRKIESPDEAEKLHPECRLFVAADGARSKMREAIFGADALDETTLQRVVEMKYKADGKAGTLGKRGILKTAKIVNSQIFEYVGREKNGATPVTLRFFVDAETYDKMPQATFKDPLAHDDPRLPPSLAEDIATYMAVRREKADERYQPGSGKLSKLTLSVYRAKKFAAKRGDAAWFLAGDAAMGVPYFRSLNAGMIIGSQLGGILAQDLLPRTGKVRAYNLLRPADTTLEFMGAKGKNTGIKALDAFRKIDGKNPASLLKWSSRDRVRFRKRPDSGPDN